MCLLELDTERAIKDIMDAPTGNKRVNFLRFLQVIPFKGLVKTVRKKE